MAGVKLTKLSDFIAGFGWIPALDLTESAGGMRGDSTGGFNGAYSEKLTARLSRRCRQNLNGELRRGLSGSSL